MISVFQGAENLSLVPGTEVQSRLQQATAGINPAVGVEILLLLQSTERNFDNPGERLGIYNKLHAISTLQGIEYFSHTRQKQRILFSEAYAVNSAETKKSLPDPLSPEIKPADQLFAFIRDSTFGKYTGRIDYRSSTNFFSMDIKNESRIFYLLIPVVAPGKLNLYLALFPRQDTILFYGMTCVNTPGFPGMTEQHIPSFTNRLKAMFDWFRGQLENP